MTAAKALKTLQKRAQQEANQRSYSDRLLDGLFEKQLEVINSPSFFKVACCSRGAGKTFLCARYMVKVAIEKPGSIILYIGLTLKRAKQLMLKELKMIKRATDIQFTINGTDLTIAFPNGSEIRLLGANNESLAENLRGDRYSLVVLDESGSFRGHLEYLIEDCIIPALLGPLGHGTLLMIGTPTGRMAGPFYDAYHSETGEWEKFYWTMHNNPHMPDVQGFLMAILKRKKWSYDNPTFQREYLGIWTGGDDYLVYRFDPTKNIYKLRPAGIGWNYVLGVDFGSKDETAFVVGCYSKDSPKFYVVHAYKKSHMDVTDIANYIKGLQKQYNFDIMTADCGALGLTIADEIRNRHGIPLIGAKKVEKLAHIELMNSDMHEARIMVTEDSPIITEWLNLRKNEDGKEDKRDSNHLCDATLYAWRMSRHYWYEEEPAKPDENSDEYKREMERQHEREVLESIEAESSTLWWERL